jgi:hypothetical protein
MRETADTSINPTAARYIKLGEGGKWERECIKEQHTLRIGFEEVPHSLCSEGKWEEAAELLVKESKSKSVATTFARQLRLFYEGAEDILWITFYRNRLWWCFSRPEVTVLSDDGSRTRPVIGRWQSCDVNGQPLEASRLSGKLLMMRRFQGTMCSVGHQQFTYLLRKINAIAEPDVEAARSARDLLAQRVETIVRSLHWRDFEILIDLIFREAGWRRISELGGSQTPFDLELRSPITGERYGVQIKSQADLETFLAYQDECESLEGFSRFYFAVHSPSPELELIAPEGKVQLLRPAEVADRAVRYGLVDWVIDKAG